MRYITVTVNQLEKLNALLDAALDSGVNRVNNIQLKVKDETQYKQKHVSQLLRMLKRKHRLSQPVLMLN